MTESVTCSNYYPDANLMAPPFWSKNKPAESISYDVPDIVINRSRFEPSFKPSNKGLEYCRYEYYEVTDSVLAPNVIVARNPTNSLQRVVGPLKVVEEVMFALNILDKVLPKNEFHNMDIVCGSLRPSLNKKSGYKLRTDGRYITNDLLEGLGVNELLANTRFSKPTQDKPNIGIYCDVQWPVFFIAEQPNGFAYNMIYRAHEIVHDWTHVIQERIGNYSMKSRAIEIQAITNGHAFTAALIKLPVFNSIPVRDQYLIHAFLKRGNRFIQSYLNNGGGHRTKKDFRKEDVVLSDLPKNLYQYGRPIKFNG